MAKWFYIQDGEPVGPVSWAQLSAEAAAGRLGPDQLVRLESSDDWVPARSVANLFATATPVALPQGTGTPLAYSTEESIRNSSIIRNLSHNVAAMFPALVALTVLSPLPLIMAFTEAGLHTYWLVAFAIFTGLAIPLAGLFAAMYLFVYWEYLMELNGSRRTLALLGGFGLIALAVVWGSIVAILVILS